MKPLVNTLAQLQQMGAERFEQIQVIDMRYASGVAIAWKKGFTPDWEQPDGKSVAWVLSRKRQG